jgi:hypothetical protein
MVLDYSCSLQGCNGSFFAPKMSLDNVPSTLGLQNQYELLRFPLTEVSCLHVIFYLNGVLVVKQASSSCTQMQINYTFALKPRLKDFLISCLSQFKIYIWLVT